MPPGAVYVGRPTRWGNPFPNDMTLERFEIYAEQRAEENPDWLEPLRCKTLACWCRMDRPCHADILMELANYEQEQS